LFRLSRGDHDETTREPGEDLDAFADRAASAEKELNEALLVLGDLPTPQAQHELALTAYDVWLQTDDGVPPEECTSPLVMGAISRKLIRCAQEPSG
jgi:hypothetical protein